MVKYFLDLTVLAKKYVISSKNNHNIKIKQTDMFAPTNKKYLT